MEPHNAVSTVTRNNDLTPDLGLVRLPGNSGR